MENFDAKQEKEKILSEICKPVMERFVEEPGSMTKEGVYLSGVEHAELIWDTYKQVLEVNDDRGIFELALLEREFQELKEWRENRRTIRDLELDEAAFKRFCREIDKERPEISMMEIETMTMKKDTDVLVRRQVHKRMFMLSGYTAVVDFMNSEEEKKRAGGG